MCEFIESFKKLLGQIIKDPKFSDSYIIDKFSMPVHCFNSGGFSIRRLNAIIADCIMDIANKRENVNIQIFKNYMIPLYTSNEEICEDSKYRINLTIERFNKLYNETNPILI